MATAYPILSTYFGILTGLAYTLPFAVSGLFFAKVTPKVNRKMVLAVCMGLCGVVMSGVSVLDSFAFLAFSRVLLGTLSAFLNQLQFSLLSDYFPVERRATANSLFNSSNYVGWGLSSLQVMMIRKMGWRSAYGFLGTLSYIFSAIVLLLVREPKKKGSQNG